MSDDRAGLLRDADEDRLDSIRPDSCCPCCPHCQLEAYLDAKRGWYWVISQKWTAAADETGPCTQGSEWMLVHYIQQTRLQPGEREWECRRCGNTIEETGAF